MIRDAKANTAAQHAARARDEHRTVFLYKFAVPGSTGLFSGPVPDAAEVVEAVESAGWVLVDMSYAETPRRKSGAVLLLFRPRRG